MDASLSPRFPQEIFVKIINQLAVPFHETERIHPWDNEGRLAKRALMQCRLVAHSFHDAASDHLFKEVHLNSDEEEDDKRLGDFLELIKAPRGGILRHVEYLDLKGANLMWRREITLSEKCRLLATVLDRILDLHRSQTKKAADGARALRLQTLDIYFCQDGHGGMHRWTDLTKELRDSITALCCEVPLDTLDIQSINAVPPELFKHLQAKTLVLSTFTPLQRKAGSSITFPKGPLPPSALKHIITDSPAWIPASLQEFTFLGGWDFCDPRLISHHASTLETLRFSGPETAIKSIRGYPPLVTVLRNATFPRLEKLGFRNTVYFNYKANPKGRLGRGNSPFHYHPDVLLDILQPFTIYDKAPRLQTIEMTLSLDIDTKHARKRRECLWDYTGCDVESDEEPVCSPRRWSDLDNFLHALLTSRRDQRQLSIKVRVRFEVQVYYKKDTPSKIEAGGFREEEIYWQERGWPTSTVSEVLPRLVKSFPEAVSFDSSFEVRPSPYEEMD